MPPKTQEHTGNGVNTRLEDRIAARRRNFNDHTRAIPSAPQVRAPTLTGSLSRKDAIIASINNRRPQIATANLGRQTVAKGVRAVAGRRISVAQVTDRGSVVTTKSGIVRSTKIRHARLGMDGERISFRQPLTDMSLAAGTNQAFGNSGTLATVTSAQWICLSPDILNGPVAAKATWYNRYRFSHITIHYRSACATSMALAASVGIVDGFPSVVPANFSNVRLCEPSVVFPLWQDNVTISHSFRTDELYYTLYDATNLATIRQTVQAVIVAFVSSAAGAVTGTHGYFDISGELELYDPVSTQGFTFMSKLNHLFSVSGDDNSSHDQIINDLLDKALIEQKEKKLLAEVSSFEKDYSQAEADFPDTPVPKSKLPITHDGETKEVDVDYSRPLDSATPDPVSSTKGSTTMARLYGKSLVPSRLTSEEHVLLRKLQLSGSLTSD
jgi:hypothetical protein